MKKIYPSQKSVGFAACIIYDFSISQHFSLKKMTSFTEKCRFCHDTDCEAIDNTGQLILHIFKEKLKFVENGPFAALLLLLTSQRRNV